MKIQGVAASPGIALGPAFLLKVKDFKVVRRELAGADEATGEVRRLRDAVDSVDSDLSRLAESVEHVVEGRQIVEFLRLLLRDPMMQSEVEQRIARELVCAEFALSSVLQEILARFMELDDPYMRERVADVRDVGRRLLEKLLGTEKEALARSNEPMILVTEDLNPSDTASIDTDLVSAIVTDRGGSTSHTAILARSMGIPAVVALEKITGAVSPRDTLVVDGIHGCVIVNPSPEELDQARRDRTRYLEAELSMAENAQRPAETADGVRIELSANIEFPQEVELVRKYGGQGVGLFRTEFLRVLRQGLETEEDHFRIYDQVAAALAPDPVIIRTYDMGGDKFRPGMAHEANPFLGYRGVRICLDSPEEFRKQVRGIIRASRRGNVRMMFPMITHVEQMRRIRELISEITDGLYREGIPFDRGMQVGFMVETPAAVTALDLLLPYADFVSIGTNDLTQYTLAVDRGSPLVADLYDPFHPAVLRQIDQVVKLSHSRGKWVGVCGIMAGDPLAVPLLLGLGVDELSVAGAIIPDVKKMISVFTTHSAFRIASEALTLPTGRDIRAMVYSQVVGRYPDILLDENLGIRK
jgi:phosphotransferase system enzyme I (PtsI)